MSSSKRNNRGFSLVELMAVLCVMGVLIGLTLPAISGARSTYNRKSAVDVVMSTIEQARVAALQSGENVYVILALAADSGVSPDAMIVAGDPPIGSTATSEIYYTHWIKLPTNVRFVLSAKTITAGTTGGLPTAAFPISAATMPPPPLSTNPTPLYFYFSFNSTGTVAYPTTGLELGLYEGYRGSTYIQKAVGPTAKSMTFTMLSGVPTATGTFDVIRMSQYSGRTWMDVSGL